MRVLRILLFCLVLSLGLARATPERDYLQVYTLLNDSERLERQGDFAKSLAGFENAYQRVAAIRQADPDWETALVIARMVDCHEKILELESKVNGSPATSLSAGPSAPSAQAFAFADWPVVQRSTFYPWKKNIVTTVFWIGERSTTSSWNPNWVRDNGGADDQYDMNGYGSDLHASALNPFYVALPFNDLTHPELTYRWLPRGWINPLRDKNGVSVCKDRWIEIKNQGGRVCFAQWEDVGPKASDDAAYVFGPNRPAETRGLNISPAVAKYLGVDSTALLSWRFVDDDDVRPGMWMRYNEQAVLFRAMHQSALAGNK